MRVARFGGVAVLGRQSRGAKQHPAHAEPARSQHAAAPCACMPSWPAMILTASLLAPTVPSEPMPLRARAKGAKAPGRGHITGADALPDPGAAARVLVRRGWKNIRLGLILISHQNRHSVVPSGTASSSLGPAGRWLKPTSSTMPTFDLGCVCVHVCVHVHVWVCGWVCVRLCWYCEGWRQGILRASEKSLCLR